MKTTAFGVFALLAVAMTFAAGCEKKPSYNRDHENPYDSKIVRMTFINNTGHDQEVFIRVNEGPRLRIGNVRHDGNRLIYDMNCSYHELPLKVEWETQIDRGHFEVTKNSDRKVVITLGDGKSRSVKGEPHGKPPKKN
jgi:hypothetical protein